jgi:hypothetical protein
MLKAWLTDTDGLTFLCMQEWAPLQQNEHADALDFSNIFFMYFLQQT